MANCFILAKLSWQYKTRIFIIYGIKFSQRHSRKFKFKGNLCVNLWKSKNDTVRNTDVEISTGQFDMKVGSIHLKKYFYWPQQKPAELCSQYRKRTVKIKSDIEGSVRLSTS